MCVCVCVCVCVCACTCEPLFVQAHGGSLHQLVVKTMTMIVKTMMIVKMMMMVMIVVMVVMIRMVVRITMYLVLVNSALPLRVVEMAREREIHLVAG